MDKQDGIVFVEHQAGGQLFAFCVRPELAKYIRKESQVICDTRLGLTRGRTKTGVIYGDGALDVAVMHGAKLDGMKYVVGIQSYIINEGLPF